LKNILLFCVLWLAFGVTACDTGTDNETTTTTTLSVSTTTTAPAASISLTLVSSHAYTPNEHDVIGAFARIYYHPLKNKFYMVYAARKQNQTTPPGMLDYFRWIELDESMKTTGAQGTLSGQTGAGDFAMVMAGDAYYHLTTNGSTGDYLLTKYDENFSIVDSTVIDLDPCESNIDQLMNYTNGRLIIGAMQDKGVCPPVNPPSLSLMPYTDIYQYDLDLKELAPPHLLETPSKITWGASIIYHGGYYYEITMNNFNDRNLYAYAYDQNFNYVSSTLLDDDGQWSQGVLFDGKYFYVAFHTGDHNHGNIILKIFDEQWNAVYQTQVTSYDIPTQNGVRSYNANRPFLLKLGDALFVSYDVESYDYPVNNKDWQANLKVYRINVQPDFP